MEAARSENAVCVGPFKSNPKTDEVRKEGPNQSSCRRIGFGDEG